MLELWAFKAVWTTYPLTSAFLIQAVLDLDFQISLKIDAYISELSWDLNSPLVLPYSFELLLELPCDVLRYRALTRAERRQEA